MKKVVTGVIGLGLVACGTGPTQYAKIELNEQEQVVVSNKPASLQADYQKLFEEGRRNAVLNHMEIGVKAMYEGHFELAEQSFDSALSGIETIYADNEEARKARSLWYEEGGKDFKGEPYERAMAYYYRGLLYLRRGDYENARATFLSGLMQDAFAEEDQNREDFALLMFLIGWSSQKMGAPELAKQAYDELKEHRPNFEIPSADADTLVLVETGKSPRKLADGVGHYKLVYRRGKKFSDKQARIDYAGQKITPYTMEDIYWQATSRGGRPVDSIIKGKAQFRSVNAKIGGVISDISTNVMVYSPLFDDSASTVNTAGAFSLLGAAQMAIAASANPRADTRYWHYLPDLVHVAAIKSNGEKKMKVAFMDSDGNDLDSMVQQAELVADGKGSNIVWVRSRLDRK